MNFPDRYMIFVHCTLIKIVVLVYKKSSSKLIAFGGISVPQSPDAVVRNILLSSIEEWNDEEKKWEVSQLKLKEPKYEFGFCWLRNVKRLKYRMSSFQ